MATVGQLIYEVGADTDKAKRNLSDLHGEVGRAPGLLGAATGALAGFVAGGAILNIVSDGFHMVTGAIGDSIGKAAESQAVMAQTNAVLKSTHGQAGMTAQAITDLATQYMNLTGTDDEVVQSTENMLLTFGNISSKTFPQATLAALDMSQAFHAMGKDTSPVDIAVMLGKALNDPLTGMTALQRVGVTFDDQQKKAITTAMAHKDILSAQKVVLAELSKEFGGSAAAAGQTFQGKMALLSATFDNLKETVGNAFLPLLTQMLTAVTPLISAFGDWLAPKLSLVTGLFSNLGSVFGGGLSQGASLLGTFFQNVLVPAFGQLQGITAQALPILQHLATTFTTQILPAALSIAQIFISQVLPTLLQVWLTIQANLLPAIMSLGTMLLTQLVPAILRLVASVAPVLVPVLQVLGFIIGNVLVPVLGIVITVLATVIGWITNLIGWIGNAIGVVAGWAGGWQSFVATIQGAISAGFAFIRGIIDGAIKFVADLFVWLYGHNVYFHMLVDNIRTAFNGARAFIMSIWTTITGWLGAQFNLIKSIAQTAWSNFVGVIQGAIGAAASAVGSVVDAVLGPVKDLGGKLFAAAKAAVQMIIDGIKSMIGAVGAAAGDVAGAIWKNLGFHSPTEEGPGSDADTWMPNLGNMLESGLHSSRSRVSSAALALAGDLATALGGGNVARASLSVTGGSSGAASSTPLVGAAAAGASGGSGGRPIYLVMDDAGRRTVAKGIMPDVVAELERMGVKTGT
jgi:hypothetical protein